MSEVTSGTRAAGIWYRVISAADNHALSPAAARVLLRWKFPESDRQRVDQLSGKASAGKLSLTEQCELDEYLAHRRGPACCSVLSGDTTVIFLDLKAAATYLGLSCRKRAGKLGDAVQLSREVSLR